MDLTRADRIATAQRLLTELKSPRRASDDPQAEGPRGDCGRDPEAPCGMIAPNAEPTLTRPTTIRRSCPLPGRGGKPASSYELCGGTVETPRVFRRVWPSAGAC